MFGYDTLGAPTLQVEQLDAPVRGARSSLIREGRTNKDIQAALEMSPNTLSKIRKELKEFDSEEEETPLDGAEGTVT